jgi:FkbM family methyltransferase
VTSLVEVKERGESQMMMTRLEWYSGAIKSLGVGALARRQLQKRFGSGDYVLTSKALRYPVTARRGTTDLAVFDQIFVEREYRCLDNIEEPALIIDCGANVGYSSAYFLSRHQNCYVIAVEPDPENFIALRRNVRVYGNRCQTIQGAIWPKHEPLCFDAPPTRGAEWATSVKPGKANDRPIKTVTIPELIKLTPYRRISILKIDIEGAEAALFGAQTEWLDFVDSIVIELHNDMCRERFFSVVNNRDFDISICGELTCCIRLK